MKNTPGQGLGLQSIALIVQGAWFMNASQSGEFAHIGRSVSIKGELSGSEDIYVDGQVEGSIQLVGNSVTIGPNGRVRASWSGPKPFLFSSLRCPLLRP